MKHLYLLIALFCGLSFTNCSNDDPQVDYYIKYIVKSAASYIDINSVTIATDKGMSTLEFKNRGSWEQTYGPVKKGFKASISVNGHTRTVEIHCCRGKEPFALKAINNEQASNPSLEYTIDY